MSEFATPSVRRVSAHTSAETNQRLKNEFVRRLTYFAAHLDEIEARLDELDREWDIERAIETNASALAFVGIVLGVTGDRRWLLLPAAVTAFLFQHAIQGWCPPVPILRRLGFRTVSEIDHERYALKAMRGDFADVESAKDKDMASLRAVIKGPASRRDRR